MSLIGDALRRAEHESCPRRTAAVTEARNLKPQPGGRSSSTPEADDWIASKGRDPRRPSASALIIVALSAVTIWALAHPNWGEGFRGLIPGTGLSDPARANPRHAAAGMDPTLTMSAGQQDTAERVASEPRIAAPEAAQVDRGTPGETATTREVLDREIPSVAAPPSPQVGALRVEGVMIGGTHALAVVNGTIVEAGQTIDGARIVAVTRKGVSVEMNGQTHHLPVHSGAAAQQRR